MSFKKNKILVLLFFYFVLWNAQYFFEQLPPPTYLFLILLLAVLFFIFSVTIVVQLLRFFNGRRQTKKRVIKIGLITLTLVLTYFKPFGLIDFRQFEGKNILVALREGASCCSCTIRLKENNRFKDTSICFGVTHDWGSYKVVGDTIKFDYDKKDKIPIYGILKVEEDNSKKGLGYLFLHSENIRKDGLPMKIYELNREKLKNQ